tara:strand:- start:163 stop:561 length:399 start_codon:yes stop_codon:yes gene_type:complete
MSFNYDYAHLAFEASKAAFALDNDLRGNDDSNYDSVIEVSRLLREKLYDSKGEPAFYGVSISVMDDVSKEFGPGFKEVTGLVDYIERVATDLEYASELTELEKNSLVDFCSQLSMRCSWEGSKNSYRYPLTG